jgi:hypothetical protein
MTFFLKNYSYDSNKILLYKFRNSYRVHCSFYNLKDWVKSLGTKEFIFNTFNDADQKAKEIRANGGF